MVFGSGSHVTWLLGPFGIVLSGIQGASWASEHGVDVFGCRVSGFRAGGGTGRL